MWSDASPRSLWPICKHWQRGRFQGLLRDMSQPWRDGLPQTLKTKRMSSVRLHSSHKKQKNNKQLKRNKKSRGRLPILPLEKVEYFNKADFCSWLLRITYQTQSGLIWSGPNADKYQEELVHWDAVTLSCNTIFTLDLNGKDCVSLNSHAGSLLQNFWRKESNELLVDTYFQRAGCYVTRHPHSSTWGVYDLGVAFRRSSSVLTGVMFMAASDSGEPFTFERPFDKCNPLPSSCCTIWFWFRNFSPTIIYLMDGTFWGKNDWELFLVTLHVFL